MLQSHNVNTLNANAYGFPSGPTSVNNITGSVGPMGNTYTVNNNTSNHHSGPGLSHRDLSHGHGNHHHGHGNDRHKAHRKSNCKTSSSKTGHGGHGRSSAPNSTSEDYGVSHMIMKNCHNNNIYLNSRATTSSRKNVVNNDDNGVGPGACEQGESSSSELFQNSSSDNYNTNTTTTSKPSSSSDDPSSSPNCKTNNLAESSSSGNGSKLNSMKLANHNNKTESDGTILTDNYSDSDSDDDFFAPAEYENGDTVQVTNNNNISSVNNYGNAQQSSPGGQLLNSGFPGPNSQTANTNSHNSSGSSNSSGSGQVDGTRICSIDVTSFPRGIDLERRILEVKEFVERKGLKFSYSDPTNENNKAMSASSGGSYKSMHTVRSNLSRRSSCSRNRSKKVLSNSEDDIQNSLEQQDIDIELDDHDEICTIPEELSDIDSSHLEEDSDLDRHNISEDEEGNSGLSGEEMIVSSTNNSVNSSVSVPVSPGQCSEDLEQISSEINKICTVTESITTSSTASGVKTESKTTVLEQLQNQGEELEQDSTSDLSESGFQKMVKHSCTVSDL